MALPSLAVLPAAIAAAAEDEPDLADYFGFEPLEVIRVGNNAGPVAVADMNGNGLNDLVIINNHASRIEIHYQRPDASPDDAVDPPRRVNEFPEHWRYRRENISVTHRVRGLVVHDFDGDGMQDIIYSGQPGEIVFLRQVSAEHFEIARRHRVRNLSSSRDRLALADVIGDERPELISLVDGEIHIWTIDGDSLEQPMRLSAGATIAAFAVEDFNGNGRNDIVGMIPEDSAPIRMWFGRMDGDEALLGPQMRFEMPALRDIEPVRLPNFDGARLAAIEQASRRLMVYEIDTDEIPDSGHREASFHVFGFTDPDSRTRDLAVADVDGNGLLDVVVTDTRANAVVVYRQEEGRGLLPPEVYPNLSNLNQIAAGRIDGEQHAELYVVSEDEKVVGRSRIDADGIHFPRPLSISEGYEPVALGLVDLDGTRTLAVVSRDGRTHIVDLLDLDSPDAERRTVELGSLVRSPQTVLALDADQDGRTDLLLFTRDRPMMMLHATGDAEEPYRLLESRDMGQFGLVQGARAENTATFDIDGSGKQELLIADRNYVRAVRYDGSPPAGVSPGWQVIKQINTHDPASQLVSVTLVEDDRIVAADRENNRLVIFTRDDGPGSAWLESESLTVYGFSFSEVHAGAFCGDGQSNILAVGSDGFAVIRLAGERITLRETAAWRSTEERQMHHEMAAGDLNSDGFTDLVALDAGEQMCDVFTFAESGRMLHAMSFKVYESRIFTGGAAREFQPNQIIIEDVTGNGANDLMFISHDRVLIHPQMVRE